MKSFKRFLLLVFCALPIAAGAQVATTAGSNLTAWNGNAGATNNNNWNQLMNNRTGVDTGAKADFGNCNSLILRCAQPKCAACTTMELAVPVVSGCVNSNKECKKHGDDLIQFISAQIVASAAQKLQQQELAMKQMAAQQAAAENSQQMQQMQQQMQQMQADLQAQNANQMAQMQAALDEQKQLVAQAQAEAAAAQQAKADAEAAKNAAPVGVTASQQAAINAGVSEDVLFRQQASGEILTAVENAEMNLKKMEVTLEKLFDYAGCDSRGGNCSGPKRVKLFKKKARPVFDEFDNVVDDLYEALETALMLGIDVSDILMMMNGSCNRWGRYACHSNGQDSNNNAVHNVAYYADNKEDTSDKDGSCKKGRRVPGSCINGKSVQATCTTDNKETYSVKGGQECTPGMVVPPQDDALCTMIGTFAGNDTDAVRREWLDENYDGDRMVRIGCASSALDSIGIFARRRGKKASTLDLDTLERILEQDAAEGIGSSRYKDEDIRNREKFQYCALSVDGHRILTTAINTQKFKQSEVCVESAVLRNKAMNADWARSLGNSSLYPDHIPEAYDVGSCKTLSGDKGCWNGSKCMVRLFESGESDNQSCSSADDCKHGENSTCTCSKCGMYNYWNGGSVVTVDASGTLSNDTKEVLCKMYGHTWYDVEQATTNNFTVKPCCKKKTGAYWDGSFNNWECKTAS